MTTTIATPPDAVDPQSPTARRASWFGWWFYVLVIVIAPFALVLAAGVGFYVWWKLADAKAAHEVGLEVARVQALGEPVTIYDLYAWHRVPAGANDITLLWLAALTKIAAINTANAQALPIVGMGERDSLAADAPNSQLALAEAFLQANDGALQSLLLAAKEQGESRLPVDFQGGTAPLLPTVQQERSAARLMSLRMRVSVERGNSEAAIESIEVTLALLRAIEHQPTLVEQLVRIAIVGVAMNDIEFLLNNGDLSDDQLARLQAQVQTLEIERSFTTSLIGERGVGFHGFHTFPPLVPPATRVATAADPMAGGELIRPADCKFHLLLMQDLIDASRQPPPGQLQNLKLLDARVAQAGSIASMQHTLSMQMLPGARAAFIANARVQASRSLLLMAIAAEQYRSAHGEYPPDLESLAAFLPAVPIDPYDGQPLRMKLTQSELIFYSVGRDGKDDGGRSVDPSEPDIVVRLTKP